MVTMVTMTITLFWKKQEVKIVYRYIIRQTQLYEGHFYVEVDKKGIIH